MIAESQLREACDVAALSFWYRTYIGSDGVG
jgi:hypothetical protein